ncbi:hypothetical protein [Compostimonas suwonensis]|uniref:ABC-type phosphate transport system substrate-binding protein n=1 Tax=Compostimonas suwonensis TaxID=1048394 RepID=A0A2M9C038_9MICO|nr:hypothetical protein [Compostimonas suwonensis]PJJ63713.1 ABC-type phosphate transport system substrate-binding protein [Compostimonas suwonensis]
MNNVFRKVAVAAAAMGTVGVLAFGGQAAVADPLPFPTYVGVGSDTTQDVMNGISDVLAPLVGSYNATGTPYIQTRSGGPEFTRPNGSGNGVKALAASIVGGNSYNSVLVGGVPTTGNIAGQVDFARSSSGPANNGAALTYLPFAKDAVTYATRTLSTIPDNIPLRNSSPSDTSSLTLENIYSCRTPLLDAATSISYSVGSDSVNTAAIQPLIPQSGSGTRSYFIGQIGLTEATLGACVSSRSNGVQEHDGTALTKNANIVPFSIAQYVAQSNGVVASRLGAAVVKEIDGVEPTEGVVPDLTTNADFPVTRDVYNVVESARITPGNVKYDATLTSIFVRTSTTPPSVCQQTPTIVQYGFIPIGVNCGVIAGTAALPTLP